MINKLVDFLNKQEHKDKVLHFIAGFVLSALFTLSLSQETAFIGLLIIAIAKEALNAETEGFDWVDVFVTMSGGFFGANLILMMGL